MNLTEKDLDKVVSMNLTRLRFRMRKSELAKRTGISQQVIYHYESNRTKIPASVVYIFAKALNVDINEFYITDILNKEQDI